jgi:hypothetical protein
LLKNVKTRWIDMFNLLKRVMSEYKSLIVQMHLELMKSKVPQNNPNFA